MTLTDKISKYYDTTKKYLNPIEITYDLGMIVLSSTIMDFIGFGIDSPIENLANGSGFIVGACIGTSIKSGNKSRYNRGIHRGIAAGLLATALRLYASDSEDISGYLTEVSENIGRFIGGGALGIWLFAHSSDGRNGGDNTPEKDPDPENPREKDVPTPSYDIPGPIKDRNRPFVPEPSRN